MPVNPAEAEKLAKAAELLAIELPVSKARTTMIATSFWLRSEALLRQNKPATAVPLIDAALRLVNTIRPAIKLQGDLLQTRAGVENSLGRPQLALQDYQKAYAIFGEVGSARSQAVALQNIGLIYLEANDLEKVFFYYRSAEEAFPNDPMLTLSGSANIAGALYTAKRFRETEAEYRRAYSIANSLNNPTLEIQMLNNLARTQGVLRELDAADASLAQAFRIWQVNKSPEMTPLLFETRAELALARHQTVDAIIMVEKAIAAAGDAAATQPYWQLQYTAYRAYAQAGNSAKALTHFEIYKQLDDQSRALAASTSAALMAARFDFINQNARIATLKAGQLERDIALARLQARQNMIILGSLLLIASSIAAVLAYYLRALRRSRDTIRVVNAQLTAANTDLNNALAAKSQFLATTSHEIRTPLNGILGMTQVLLADRALSGVLRERIALMQGAGETMRALVDDILDFAKMDAGKLELHPLEADLPQLLDEIVAFWRDRAAQQGLVLTSDRTDAPERVVIDGRRLRQILANLLSNAIKFTPAGSVALTVTTVTAPAEADPADEQGGRSGERLRIAITDTGIGIAAHHHAAVFERFRQLDGGTTRRFGGTGLGLAISQMLAQAMGGDVELESAVGAGSTFTLDLPLDRAAPAMLAETSGPPLSLAKARLLLVGASPIAQGVLRAVLSSHVASFAVAADLRTASVQVAARSADVLLVDSPASSGEDSEVDQASWTTALAKTAAMVRGADGLVVVLWPNQQQDEHARLRAAGVDLVIGKPVSGSHLLEQLGTLFNTGADSLLSSAATPRALVTT